MYFFEPCLLRDSENEELELRATAAYFTAKGAQLDLYKRHDSLFILFRKMVRNVF